MKLILVFFLIGLCAFSVDDKCRRAQRRVWGVGPNFNFNPVMIQSANNRSRELARRDQNAKGEAQRQKDSMLDRYRDIIAATGFRAEDRLKALVEYMKVVYEGESAEVVLRNVAQGARYGFQGTYVQQAREILYGRSSNVSDQEVLSHLGRELGLR